MDYLYLTGNGFHKDGDSRPRHFEMLRRINNMDVIEKTLEEELSCYSIHFHCVTVLSETQARIMFPKLLMKEEKKEENSETLFVSIKE